MVSNPWPPTSEAQSLDTAQLDQTLRKEFFVRLKSNKEFKIEQRMFQALYTL